MLCHLCGFGVVSVGLMFDLVKRLLESFTPLDIELLLSVLTRASPQKSFFNAYKNKILFKNN